MGALQRQLTRVECQNVGSDLDDEASSGREDRAGFLEGLFGFRVSSFDVRDLRFRKNPLLSPFHGKSRIENCHTIFVATPDSTATRPTPT
jgi:hypothetical protein